MERIYSGDPDKFFKLHQVHGLKQLDEDEHINALQLDPSATLKYVQNIDTNREMLAKLIKVYPGYIKYQRYDYEDLIGPFSHLYWQSILNWIGGPNLSKYKRNAKMNHKFHNQTREHPYSCFTKISNWPEIKQILKGYESEYACEKLAS